MKRIYVIMTVFIGIIIISVCAFLSIRDRYAVEEFAYSTPLRENTKTVTELNGKSGKAYVMPEIYTFEKAAALTFSDIPSEETVLEIIEILDAKGIKATFFIKGARIYEEPSLPQIIASKGHFIGNDTLTGKSDFYKMSKEEMVSEFAETNALIEKAAGASPEYFRCEGQYTDTVLESAFEAGLKAAAPYTIKIDGNTLENKDESDRFIKFLRRGSVISVDASDTENLCRMLEFLIESSQEAGLSFVSLGELEKLNDSSISSKYDTSGINFGKKTEVIARADCADRLVTLTFDGIGEKDLVYGILDALDKENIKAIFFMSGEEVIEKTDTAKEIIRRGHEIGSNLMSGKNISNMDFSETYAEVKNGNDVFGKYLGVKPRYIRPKNGSLNNSITSVASHTDQLVVTYSKNPLDKKMISAEEITEAVKHNLRNGDIIILNADTNLEVIRAVGLISQYMREKNFSVVPLGTLLSSPKAVKELAVGKSEKNNTGKRAFVKEPTGEFNKEVFSYASTTAKRVALTFDGLGNEKMINGILNALDNANIKATFFLPANKVSENVSLAKRIRDRGHEIGLNTSSKLSAAGADYSMNYTEIKNSSEVLEDCLDIEIEYIRPAFGRYSDKMLKAADNLGKKVVTYSKNPLDRNMISADQIMEYIEKKITRGEIIILNADTNPAVIEAIPRIADFVRDIGYDFTTVDDLYNGQYEVKRFEDIPGHDAIKINYSLPDTPPEFISEVPNNDKKVFITFDDWGGDKVVTSILDTLERKNVKASFFLRAAGVENNMNLAKAIEEAGHDIASHTYSHTDIIDMEYEDLQADLYKAHKVITTAIQRQPELYMRPPRLYTTDDSMRAVKAMGYRAIMSADVSSHDWEHDLSGDIITDDILDRTKDGTVIILHMLDDAKGYQILEDLIDRLRAKGFEFAKLSEYLE